MLICGCSLAGTEACYSCSEYLKYYDSITPIHFTKLGKFLRVIEKFDKDGKVIERITERGNEDE